MNIYRNIMDFIADHLLLVMFTIVLCIILIFFFVDRESVMMTRAIIFFVLWFSLLIYTVFSKVKTLKGRK